MAEDPTNRLSYSPEEGPATMTQVHSARPVLAAATRVTTPGLLALRVLQDPALQNDWLEAADDCSRAIDSVATAVNTVARAVNSVTRAGSQTAAAWRRQGRSRHPDLIS